MLVEIDSSTENPSEKYTDAVFFESSYIDIKFIIASTPTKETADKFFKLIFAQKPTILISLSKVK